MSRLLRHLRSRGRLLVFASGAGLLAAVLSQGAPTADEAGLHALLSRQCDLQVSESLWEPSRGVVGDFLWGRPLLLSARGRGDGGSALRDIFRARIRLSPEGAPLSVSACRNLSRTEESDEHTLRGAPGLAVFASEGKNSAPSLTLLGLEGEPLRGRTSWTEQLQLGLTRFMESGTWSGLARTDLITSSPEDELSLEYRGDSLVLSGSVGGESLDIVLQLRKPVDAQLRDSTTSALSMRSVHRAPVAWTHFGANSLRGLIGTEAVARIERMAFGIRDRLHRLSYALLHEPAAPRVAPQPPPSPIAAASRSDHDASLDWPPRALPRSTARHPNDGRWVPVRSELLPSTQVPLFYRTMLHPDPERPYAELHLVAMDLRQLELGMRAGYEDPEPKSGPPGSGHLPEELAPRVVATFNGAFKSTHGGYGMKAEGRVLLPPVTGAATVAVTRDGRTGLGAWPSEFSAEDFRSFRQNLDPLIRHGKRNPRGRTTWGEHVDATGVAIERSALCLHDSGALLYAWATEATGESLAAGLQQAGCREAIHLDMNPGHCAFLFNRVRSVDPLDAEGEVLDQRMKVNTTRYVRWSPKDFFFLALREPVAAEYEGAARAATSERDGLSFQPAPGQLPTPAFVPGAFLSRRSWGPLDIEVDRIEPERVSFSVLPGAEDTPAGVSVRGPEEPPLLAWGLGHQSHGMRPGLTLGTQVLVPLHRRYATLVLARNEAPRLLPPGEPLTEAKAHDLVQFPVLARDGELLPEARQLGGRRGRAAFCLDTEGALLVARMEHDSSAPLGQLLLEEGCQLVVEMDRGSHSPPRVRRAGTEQPPLLQQALPQSRLLALDRQMRHRSFSF